MISSVDVLRSVSAKSPEGPADDTSSESHESSEPAKSPELLSDEEDETKSSKSEEVDAEALQIGFFHFCESFLPTYIEQLQRKLDGSWVIASTKSDLIRELTSLDGKIGVELWEALPFGVGVDVARMWLGFSKDKKATYIAEGVPIYHTRRLKIQTDKTEACIRAVLCEDFLKDYTVENPSDLSLSELSGKTGFELLNALPSHLKKLFEEAMESYDHVYMIKDAGNALRCAMTPEISDYLARAKKLWDENFEKEYQNYKNKPQSTCDFDYWRIEGAEDCVRGVLCEDFLKDYIVENPSDPSLSELSGKTGLELLSALPSHIKELFEKAMESEYNVALIYDRRKNLIYSMSPEISCYVARAMKLWDEDLVKAYKKELEEAAKAEQEVKEAAEDQKSAFYIFSQEYLKENYDKDTPLTEEIKDEVDRNWTTDVKAVYVDEAKKRRVSHENASKLEEVAKAEELKIEEQIEAYKKKLDDVVLEDDNTMLYVEPKKIHLPSKRFVTPDGVVHETV